MATQLENFIWELKRPVDFQSNANTMRNGAKQAGRARGLKVRTTVVDDDTLVIQAYEDVLHEFNAEPF